MSGAATDARDGVNTTSSSKLHSVSRDSQPPLTTTSLGLSSNNANNNSHPAGENGAHPSGRLFSFWTRMSEHVEMRTLETQPSVSSVDSGRFSGSDLFESGESINSTLGDRGKEHHGGGGAAQQHQQQQQQRNQQGQRNSILLSGWNYFFGGSSSSSTSTTTSSSTSSNSQLDSKSASSAAASSSKTKSPPSRKNSTSSSQDVAARPRSASCPTHPPVVVSSSNHGRLPETIPAAAETEFAANGSSTWLEWNPLDEDDYDTCSDSSSIIAEEEADALNQGTGEGHDFVPVFLNFTWCDQCAGVIWGFRQCLRCSYCKYTCHYKCLKEVRLDCTESPSFKGPPSDSPHQTIVAIQNGVEDTSSLSGLSRQELMWRIEEFNLTQDEHPIKLESDSLIFVGSIRIFMNLSRPISIPSGSPLPKVCSTLRPYDHSVDQSKRRTSFFLPKNTYEDIQIASESTAIQVIQGVLSHIQVIDNCRKFALFERSEDSGEVLMRKLADDDKPLLLRLLWGGNNTTKRYELRENETGQIEWEAFTIPELQNFLRILDKEEKDHIEQVQSKYVEYEKRLRDAMAYID